MKFCKEVLMRNWRVKIFSNRQYGMGVFTKLVMIILEYKILTRQETYR